MVEGIDQAAVPAEVRHMDLDAVADRKHHTVEHSEAVADCAIQNVPARKPVSEQILA